MILWESLALGGGRKYIYDVTNIGAWTSTTSASMPAGIAAGDIAFYAAVAGGNAGEIDTPSGFTLISNVINTSSTDNISHISYKILDGTETSYTLTEATNGTVTSSVFVVVRGATQYITDDAAYRGTYIGSSQTVSIDLTDLSYSIRGQVFDFDPEANDLLVSIGLTRSGSWSNPVNFEDIPLNTGTALVASYLNKTTGGDSIVLSADVTGTGEFFHRFFVR
jgi:hypothetical protein